MATESLTFKSGLDDSKFQAGLNRMEKGAKASTGKISGMMKGIGIAALAKGAINAADGVLEMGGALDDQSRSLNMNVETMQKLQGVMIQGGVGQDQFVMGMKNLGEAMVKAREEGGEALEKFQKLGISFYEIDDAGNDTAKMFDIMSEAIKNSESVLDSTAAATDILGGKQGKMVAVMRQGTEVIKEQAKAVKILSAEQVEYNARLGDAKDLTISNLKVEAAQAGLNIANKAGTLGGIKDKVEPPNLSPGAKRRENPNDVKKRSKAEKESLEFQKEQLEVAKALNQQTMKAAQLAMDAASQSYRNAISGTPDQRSTSASRKIDRQVSEMEAGGKTSRKQGLETGKLGEGLTSNPKSPMKTTQEMIDSQKSVSSRSGAKKALDEFNKAKEEEKRAKDLDDIQKKQQEDMVKALKAIDKGINGN